MKYEGWNVGSIIRQLRRDKNMTIDELSEAVGKSVSHITQVEEGTRRISNENIKRNSGKYINYAYDT